MALRFQDVHERLLLGCACEIKQELNSLVDHEFVDLLGGELPQEDTLLGLTVLYAMSEAARKASQTKAICPIIQDALVALVQKEIVGSLLSLQMLSPDKFVAHCCLLALNSLARCSKDLQEALFSALDKRIGILGTVPVNEKTRFCQLITFLLTADTRSTHPEETTETSCTTLVTTTMQAANLNDFSSSISSAAEKCLHSMLPCLQNDAPHDTLYHALCLWLKLVQSLATMDVLGGLLPQHFVKWSTGKDPLVARTVLKILDRGLQPVIEEAKFSKVPPWVPLIGQRVIEAVHGGWLDQLHCRNGFCGFAGTSREPSRKYPEQDLALSQGDGRVIRLAMLVLLKSSAACLMQGMQEGLPKALEAGLAWLRAKTGAVASMPDEDCLVQLFLDQDDQLMECLLSELLLHLHKPSAWTATTSIADPHRMFLKFLGSLGNDHVTLIDFLTSQETCALLYFVRYLKLLLSDWANFVKCHGALSVGNHDTSGQEMAAHLDLTMATLVRTRIKLEKMTQKHNLLPFNATPLVRLIERCEEIYESV
uniref:Protein Lines N-terminal domain-containing protein n=1 Tax=Rhipicephalus appendiculatus TaxID=34631 RepID=A0A131YZB5_RHIAP